MNETQRHFSEKDLIARVLRECDGDVARAAQRLDIDQVLVRRKMVEYGLEPTA